MNPSAASSTPSAGASALTASQSVRPAGAQSWLKGLICFALLAGTLAVYAPARHFDFVNYDDQSYVINNFNVNRGLSWPMFRWAFNAGYCSNWHPLTWLSHALDCQWFGLNAGPAHVTSVVLHALTVVFLFLLLEGLTGRLWRSAVVAALFAWHPMHVESVAWISERKDVLSGLFFVLTIWAYARYARESAARPRRALVFFGASVGLFALDLMAKPMVVTLPFLLLLLDFWPLERLASANKLAARLVSLALEKVPFFVLSAISCALTMCAQSRGGAVRPLTEVSCSLRGINALVSYCRYAAKLAWPTGLSVTYPYNFHLTAVHGVGAALLLLGVTAAAATNWRRRPYCLVGWLWYLGALVPVIGLVQVGGQAIADRYSYLPSIGLFIGLCWLLGDWAGPARARRGVLALAGGAALVVCLCLTRAQVMTWRNGETLSQHSISVDPSNFMARSALASYYVNTRQLDKALAACEETLKLNPNYPPGHEYLGNVYYLQGDYAKAAEHLLLSLKIDPFKRDVHLRLGDVYLREDQPQKADEEYRAYLAYDAADPSAHCGLGKALVLENKLPEACAEFAAAIKIVDAYPEAHYQLASALSALGQPAAAIEQYDKTLLYDPNNADAMNNIAWIRASSADPRLRNGPLAVGLAERACRITTNSLPLFIGTLADAYAEAGRFDDAIAAAQRAHDVALAQTNEAVAARNLQLMELYKAHRAYHEE